MNSLPWRLLGALAGLLLLAVSTPAETTTKKAQDLVRQLGSDVYQERERAFHQLQQLGLLARAALEQGVNDPDLEISRRCQELLPDILEIDLRNRIAAFLADKEGKGNHDVPLWAHFRKVAGDGTSARQMFTEMLQGDTLLFLLDCAENPTRQSIILERFSRQMQVRAFQPGPGRVVGQYSRSEMAAVLFIASDVQTPGQQTPFIISNMLYQQAARAVLTDGSQGPVFKKLLLRWMNNQTQENVILQICNIIQNLNIPEGQDFLARTIKEKKVRGVFLAQVILNLGRSGNKNHIAVLETLLDDQTVLGKVRFNQLAGTTEVRDAALAMLVHLTGQSHREYGFSFLIQNQNLMWSPYYLGFATPEQRAQAHKKWQEWASKNKKNG